MNNTYNDYNKYSSNASLFSEKPIVVIGAGSAGERHISNLINLGFHRIWVFRQRKQPFRSVSSEQVNVLTDWQDVEKITPFATIIASPTSMHLQQAADCAILGSHILVEKPLSYSLHGIDELIKQVRNSGVYLHVAYMMRFHPLIQRIKSIINAGTIGQLLSFSSKWGEYLPDWHPWEDYRISYAGRKELGGGAALTLSHDIDLANWLCGTKVIQHKIIKNYRSELEVNVESGADIILEYFNGVTGHIHLNFYEKIPERYLRMVFTEGSLLFDYYHSKLLIRTTKTTEVIELNGFDRNKMFVDELSYFFHKLQNNYSIEDSLKQIEESSQIIKICHGD